MPVRDTSKEAYAYLEAHGITADQERLVYLFLRRRTRRQGWTRLELSDATGIPINCITRPVLNLIDKKLIYEATPRPNQGTGRNAHPVYARTGKPPRRRQRRLNF